MIKSEKGSIHIGVASIPELLTEMTMVVKACHEVVTEKEGKEAADELVNKCFELALMDEKQVRKQVNEKARELAKKIVEEDDDDLLSKILRDILEDEENEDE